MQPFKSIHYGMKGRLVCTYLYSIEAQICKKHGGKRQKPRGYRDWYQDALRSSDCSYSCVTRYVIVRFGVSLFEFGVSLLEFGVSLFKFGVSLLEFGVTSREFDVTF